MDYVKVTLLTVFIIVAVIFAGKGDCDSFDSKYLIIRGSKQTPEQMDKNAPVIIRWIRVKEDDIPVVCSRVIGFIFPIPGALGCYGWKDNVCYVYSDDTPESMMTLGHEVKHCFDGNFHNTTDWQWLEH